MSVTRLFSVILALSLLVACPNREVVPLIGEQEEVLALLGHGAAVDDPSASAQVAARRLHQALVQGDIEFAWTLLAPTTQQMLEAQGSMMGISGREALETSTLPSPSGAVRKVSFTDLFYGEGLVALDEGPSIAGTPPVQVVYARGPEGTVRELRFIQLDGLWRLVKTEI